MVAVTAFTDPPVPTPAEPWDPANPFTGFTTFTVCGEPPPAGCNHKRGRVRRLGFWGRRVVVCPDCCQIFCVKTLKQLSKSPKRKN